MNIEIMKDWRNYLAWHSKHNHPQITKHDVDCADWLITEVEHLTNQSKNIKEQNQIIVDENRKLREHNKCLQKSLDMFVRSAELRAAGII